MTHLNLKKEQIINNIKNGFIKIYELDPKLRDDKDIILEALKENGQALQYASEALRDDEECVIKAMSKNVQMLYFASNRLQSSKELLEKIENLKLKPNDVVYNRWHKQRMEFLANIRRQEEKEFMKKSINSSNKVSKKLKF